MKRVSLTIGSVWQGEVLLAESAPERVHGLNGVKYLRSDEGMLFQVSPSDTFTTAQMQIALDMIWIDRDGRVISVYRSIVPGHRLIVPPSGATWLLELGASYARAIKTGERTSIGRSVDF